MAYVSKNDLDVVNDILLDLDVEVCGMLLPEKRGRLLLYIEKIGTKVMHGKEERGTCQLDKYTKYVWHTHPKGLAAYPSVEDIIDMLKWHTNNDNNNFPVTSVIFTDWGIWKITSPKKFKMNPHGIEFFRRLVDKEISPLWYETNKGIDFNEPLVKRVVKNVVKNINNDPNVDVKIRFTKWKDIHKKYLLT
jgi:hypothetical protein